MMFYRKWPATDLPPFRLLHTDSGKWEKNFLQHLESQTELLAEVKKGKVCRGVENNDRQGQHD